MREKSKEEIKMMEFIILTSGVFVGVLLAMVTLTVLTYALLMNQKVVKLLMKYYMKMIEKSVSALEDDDQKVEA